MGSEIAAGQVVINLMAGSAKFGLRIPQGSGINGLESGKHVSADLGGSAVDFETTGAATVDSEGDYIAGVATRSSIDLVAANLNPTKVNAIEGELTLQEAVTGVVLPLATIRSRDGASFVVLADGREVEIKVLATVGGEAVVQGVAANVAVRLGEA